MPRTSVRILNRAGAIYATEKELRPFLYDRANVYRRIQQWAGDIAEALTSKNLGNCNDPKILAFKLDYVCNCMDAMEWEIKEFSGDVKYICELMKSRAKGEEKCRNNPMKQ